MSGMEDDIANLEVIGILISGDSKMNAVELVRLAQHQEIAST